ncbi:MAG: SDR family oxidoreductase [Limnobacter sp.]|nr:SDR family oxidoreductase [Limnobacter sp.]
MQQVAIVTGAAGVVGQTLSRVLGEAGYSLMLVDLQQPPWEGETDAVTIGNVDLTRPDHAQEVVEQTLQYFGQLDAVVNLAESREIETTTHMTQAALAHFQSNASGVLVSVATQEARQKTVLALMQTVAAENRALGIRANALLPSALDTPANRSNMPDQNPADWVSAQSLAEIVVFLLSNVARNITGLGFSVTGRV